MKRTVQKIALVSAALSMLIGLMLTSIQGWLDATFGPGLTIGAIVGTITSPVKGANVSGLVVDFLLSLGLPLIVLLGYGLGLWRVRATRKNLLLILALLPGFLMLGYASFSVNQRFKLAKTYALSQSTTTIYDDYYHRVLPEEVVFPEKKKNVILILLESVEDTYNEDKYFGEYLMPRLYDYQQNNLSFSGHKLTLSSDFTITAIISYLFGVPANAPIKLIEGCQKQINESTSLLRIFEQNGYELEFIQGSDADFSGKKLLMSCHLKNPHVYDLTHFLENEKSAKDYALGEWGLPDSFIYGWLKKHLASRDSDKPFFTIMLTVNTHAPHEVFENLIKPKYGDFRDVVRETDFLAADFIEWVQKQDFADDTTIIVMGDHQFYADTIGSVKVRPKAEREVFDVFINASSNLPPGRQTNRIFSSVDMAPTILESTGAKLPDGRLGLGVSLFRPEMKTLFETKGSDWYNDEIQKKSVSNDNLYYDQSQASLNKLASLAAGLLLLELFIIARRRRQKNIDYEESTA